jgi:hypothetical protein
MAKPINALIRASGRRIEGISIRTPEPLGKVFQLILSISFGIGQHRQEPRARFPRNFPFDVEVSHGVAAVLVLVQNLSYELTFGEIDVIGFYRFVGDVDPKP